MEVLIYFPRISFLFRKHDSKIDDPENILWINENLSLIQLDGKIELIIFLLSDQIMSTEAPKTAKEPFVPKYEIAAGLHKGRKLEKFATKRVRPTRRTDVTTSSCVNFFVIFFFAIEKKQTCEIRSRSRS